MNVHWYASLSLLKKTYLISHPEISESDVEERSQNNSTQDSKHPESGLMLERSGWIEEKRGHDDDQGKGIVVGLQYKGQTYFIYKHKVLSKSKLNSYSL